MSTRPQIRLVYSSSESAEDSMRLAQQRDASSSTTRRLAAYVRRLHLRRQLGYVAIGIAVGVLAIAALRIAGGVG